MSGRKWTRREFKATKYQHADGQSGNFKVYKAYHDRLQANGGLYGFAVYRKRGTGTQILKTTAVAASRLPTPRWHGGGDHRHQTGENSDL